MLMTTIHIHFLGAWAYHVIRNITIKIMPAVEKFSPTISKQITPVSRATQLKANCEAPPVVLSRNVANSMATVPTKEILANSDGCMVMPNIRIHRAASLMLPMNNTTMSRMKETRSPNTLRNLKLLHGILCMSQVMNKPMATYEVCSTTGPQ